MDEEEMYEDERINTKITVVDFDVTMSHSLPLGYFKQFIYQQKPDQEVYLNFYMLIEIYKVKVEELWKKANILKKDALVNKRPFDIRNVQDPDYQTFQIVVGRAMLNLLEYIKQNYQSHFKDLIINDNNAFDVELFNKFKDNASS